MKTIRDEAAMKAWNLFVLAMGTASERTAYLRYAAVRDYRVWRLKS